MPYSNILVPINIYEDYHHILNTAELLAHKHDARLTLLMVLDTPFELVPMAHDYQKSLEDEAIQSLSVAAEHLSLKSAETALSAGTVHTEIINYAHKHENDLIVLGSHAKHGFQLLLGSTSNAVLHHAHCDVLTVYMSEKPPASASSYQNLTIATDLSEDNDKLSDVAGEMAKNYEATINAINVQADPTVVVSTYGIAPDMHTEIMEQVENRMQAWAKEHNINGKSVCVMGNSAQEVINFSSQFEDNLIIVGSHQKNAIGRFFLGSTANAILHYAKQDVLVVRLKS